MAGPTYTPRARPVDTVGVQTRMIDGPTPVAPVRPLAPNAPNLPAPPSTKSDDLVRALAGFSKSLLGVVGTVHEQKQKEDRYEAELKAIKDNASSWAEAVEKDPSLADKSPYFRRMYESRVARNKVQAAGLAMMGEYMSSPIASSTNPEEIQKWLSDRYKPLVDSAAHSDDREAMLEEIGHVSKQFMLAHRNNAVQNLNYKADVAHGQAIANALDGATVRGGVAAFKTDDPVSKGLKGYEVALLNAIAGGESAGKYNIRFNGWGAPSATFELNGEHPAVKIPILHNGKPTTSDAAGRYQFLSSTWKRIMGDAPFTPENQDIAALKLARMDYKARTGRNLDADLQSEGFSNRIQEALTPTWQALKGNRARHAATFDKTAKRVADGGYGSAEASGTYEFAGTIHQIEAEGRLKGRSQKEIDTATVNGVIAHAEAKMDESFLAIAYQKRPDGSTGAGMTPDGREKIEAARGRIQLMRIKADEKKKKQEEAEKDSRAEYFTDKLAGEQLAALEKGVPFTVNDADKAAYVKAFGAERATKMLDTLTKLGENRGAEDPRQIAELMDQAHAGALTTRDALEAVRSGVIKNASSHKELLSVLKQNRESTVLNDRTIGSMLEETYKNAAGLDPMGMMKNVDNGAKARREARMALLEWERENPKKPISEAIEWFEKRTTSIVKRYNPESEFNTLKPGDVAPSKPAPSMTSSTKNGVTPPQVPKPSAGTSSLPRAAPAKEPLPDYDWRTKPVYSTLSQLSRDLTEEGLKDPNSTLHKWRKANGWTRDDIKAFVKAQQALLTGK